MSRSYYSYNEDWQRRKSLLIRSLFHDIPILSPVPEESNESSDLIQRTDTYNVPSRPLLKSPRAYSPLPPLIIEKEPNRHDEPEEYYKKLLIKIKRIYRKLFIENLDLNSDDLNLTDHSSSINDENMSPTDEAIRVYDCDKNMPEIYLLGNSNIVFNVTDNQHEVGDVFNSISGDDRESFNSTSSTGYNADSELDDSGSSHVESDSERNEDDVMIDEEEFNSIRVDDETNMKEEYYNQRLGAQKLNDNISYNRKTESRETKATDESSGEGRNELDSNDKVSNRLRKGYHDFTVGDESANMIEDVIVQQETDEREESCDNQTDERECNKTEASYNRNIDEDESIVREMELKSNKCIQTTEGEQLIVSNDEAMEEDIETNSFSEDNDYRQITTHAQVHVDGTQDAIERESRVYEDSLKSLILLSRVQILKEVRNFDVDDRIEELSELDDNEEPENTSTFNTDENENGKDHIEVMRTPRTELSLESEPITRYSESDVSTEYIVVPQEPTSMTSSSEHGHENAVQRRTSHDIDEVLSSIFNERKEQGKNIRSPLLRRKRKLYEDISVQTSDKVTWDDICGNFFVGTPKIFRLCSCVDHIC